MRAAISRRGQAQAEEHPRRNGDHVKQQWDGLSAAGDAAG
jgi:hypothetical protein